MSVFFRALTRQIQALLGSKLGMVVVLAAAIVGTTGVGLAGALTTGLIYACVNNSSGTIKIISATSTCSNNEILLVWNGDGTQGPAGPTGPQGPTGATGATGPMGATGAPGSFSGVFTSPNGLCSISVTDSGIVFAGPNCPIQVDTSNLRVRSGNVIALEAGLNTTIQSGGNTIVSSGANTTVSSGGSTGISSSGTTVVNGALVTIGGTSGCAPVARAGDSVVVAVSGGPETITVPIITGSPRVTAC